MAIYFCHVCGNPILKESKFKPFLYCSDPCRNYSKFKQQLENALLQMKPVSSSVSIIRGDMFRLANLLTNGTNTKKGIE